MATSRARPDTRTMAVVHQYYRREFELAPRIVRDTRPGQDERHAQAAAWFATTAAMMHHHHVTEDVLMYPLLVGRVPQELLDRMEEQHERLAVAVEVVSGCLSRWRLADPESAAALADAYDALLPELLEHLDDEEREVMPLVAEHLTVEEYARQGTSGNAGIPPHTLMMAFGAMVEQASPEEAAEMLANPPEHVQRAWRDSGEREHRALMKLLRVDLRPVERTPGPLRVSPSAAR